MKAVLAIGRDMEKSWWFLQRTRDDEKRGTVMRY